MAMIVGSGTPVETEVTAFEMSSMVSRPRSEVMPTNCEKLHS